MKRDLTRSLVLVAAALSFACAAAPRPRVLLALDATEKSPGVLAARGQAPQAFARAEGLRHEAEKAHDDGDPAGAQILGEQALAAFQRAITLAGVTRAEQRAAAAEVSLTRIKAALAESEQQQKQLDADTEALELRLKVGRETLPMPESGPPASPERELARREAARALTAQARLLCSAARLLDPKRATLEPAFQKIADVEKVLATNASTPIDDARSVRSTCLAELTATRRPRTQASPADPSSDELLKQLSDASLKPSRDDRGVVVEPETTFAREKKPRANATRRPPDLRARRQAQRPRREPPRGSGGRREGSPGFSAARGRAWRGQARRRARDRPGRAGRERSTRPRRVTRRIRECRHGAAARRSPHAGRRRA